MSRVGKQPVVYPKEVKVAIDEAKREIKVEGPKGKLEQSWNNRVSVSHDSDARTIEVQRRDDERQSRAMHGLFRTLINNMVVGVTQGFQKKLKIVGIGYQARMAGKKVELIVGFANRIVREIPSGVQVELPDPTTIIVSGIDKQLVGQFAAELKSARKPEPYKAKGVWEVVPQGSKPEPNKNDGIWYDGEEIKGWKEGKAVGG